MMEDQWLSTEEIADYLSVKKGTVYKWITTRNIPAYKFGHVWKFRLQEITDWVRSIGAKNGGIESVNTGKPQCKMSLRYSPFSSARLNMKLNWQNYHKYSSKC